MNQEQFDAIVTLAYAVYGNDAQGGLVSRASLDAALAVYTRELAANATLTEDEVDQALEYLDPDREDE